LSETVSDPVFDEAAEVEAYEAEQAEAAAPPPAAEAPPEADRGEGQKVPLAVLMREREAAKAAREENARLREQFDLGNKRLEMLMERLQPQRPPEPVPDINVDPVGHFQRQNAELQHKVQEMEAWKANQEQQGQQITQEQQFYRALHTQAAVFREQAPDLDQAVSFLSDSLRKDYLAVGLTMEQAQQQLRAQEQFIASNAMRQGRNPAEAIYALAKARGFAPKAADGAARMDAMQRGETAARSTMAPGGRGRFEGLTVEALASMSTADFEKVPEAVVNRLLGANR
jgi:hypothetical protein